MRVSVGMGKCGHRLVWSLRVSMCVLEYGHKGVWAQMNVELVRASMRESVHA